MPGPARLLVGLGGVLGLLAAVLFLHSRPAGAATAPEPRAACSSCAIQPAKGVHGEGDPRAPVAAGPASVDPATGNRSAGDGYTDNTVLSSTAGTPGDLTLPLAALGGISLLSGSLLSVRGRQGRRVPKHAR